MITRTFTILCLSAMASTSMAQFPVIGTAPETINEVIYTCSSGKKLLHQGVQGVGDRPPVGPGVKVVIRPLDLDEYGGKTAGS